MNDSRFPPPGHSWHVSDNAESTQGRMPMLHEFAPLYTSTATIDEPTRDLALKRTAETIRKLDEIRRAHDLPPESLAFLQTIYDQSITSALVDKRNAEIRERTQRLPLSIVSEDRNGEPRRIRKGEITQLSVRPQWCAYRVEEIEIVKHPDLWRVHDIKIGNRSQFMQPRTIEGKAFRKGGIMSEIKLETIQTAMDFVMIVEYLGNHPDGEVFEAVAVGTAVGA